MSKLKSPNHFLPFVLFKTHILDDWIGIVIIRVNLKYSENINVPFG